MILEDEKKPSLIFNILLWLAQLFIAVMFCFIGYIKVSSPISELSNIMVWAAEFPEAFVRIIGLIDIAGGIGILLPGIARIKPGLGGLAALGCTLLQVCAIVFHFSRGEGAATPMNFVFLAVCLFILWGRSKAIPIRAR
jgi:hypothetical protein